MVHVNAHKINFLFADYKPSDRAYSGVVSLIAIPRQQREVWPKLGRRKKKSADSI
jgi:hypothetical protein